MEWLDNLELANVDCSSFVAVYQQQIPIRSCQNLRTLHKMWLTVPDMHTSHSVLEGPKNVQYYKLEGLHSDAYLLVSDNESNVIEKPKPHLIVE